MCIRKKVEKFFLSYNNKTSMNSLKFQADAFFSVENNRDEVTFIISFGVVLVVLV